MFEFYCSFHHCYLTYTTGTKFPFNSDSLFSSRVKWNYINFYRFTEIRGRGSPSGKNVTTRSNAVRLRHAAIVIVRNRTRPKAARPRSRTARTSAASISPSARPTMESASSSSSTKTESSWTENRWKCYFFVSKYFAVDGDSSNYILKVLLLSTTLFPLFF